MTHWYTKAGEPMRALPNEAARKKGDATAMRDTTLRDARKLQLAPSVTTVTKMIDKGDFLLKWGKRQAIYAAVIAGIPDFTLVDGCLPEGKGTEFEAWADKCIKDAEHQVAVKAERGSILHDAMMMAHHAYDNIAPQYLAHVDGMMAMLEKNFGKRQWRAEFTFSHGLGFGGSVDLSTLPDDPDPIILDYKFKDFDESRDAAYFVYDEHKMQLGGYRIGLDMPKARCFNAFGSITDPGLVLLHSHTEDDIYAGEKMFLHALSFWKVKNGYSPEWAVDELTSLPRN